jgi:hypothetical protein
MVSDCLHSVGDNIVAIVASIFNLFNHCISVKHLFFSFGRLENTFSCFRMLFIGFLRSLQAGED